MSCIILTTFEVLDRYPDLSLASACAIRRLQSRLLLIGDDWEEFGD
jgi:hypothetical protein